LNMGSFKASKMVYEDGTEFGRYTVIPNNVLDRIAEIDLTNDEKKVLFRIIRNTVGYETTKNGTSVRKLSADFPLEYLVEKTGVSGRKVETILKRLEKRRIIERRGDTITFSHSLELWHPNDEIAEEEEKHWKELHEPKS